MLFFEEILTLEIYTVFSQWQDNLKLYSLLIFVMIVLYFIVFHIIRFVIALQLTQTLSYIITVLILVIGISTYTTVSKEVQIKDIYRMAFESIAIFGVLLFFVMSFRTLLRKIKT